MILYLIRHAHAVDTEENPVRPLSDKGRAQLAQLVAQFRQDERLQPTEFWHTPLARSRETAALLAEGLALTAPLVLTPGLEPEDDPSALLPRLLSLERDVAIVGHEPHLGFLAQLLMGQVTDFVFRKAAVLALQRNAEHWRPLWHTGPRA